MIPWTADCQVPLSMEFSRREYWSGWSFPPPGDLPDPGIEFVPPALAGRFFTTSTTWEALSGINYMSKCAERAVQGFLNLWGTEIRQVLTGSFVTYKPHSSSSFVVETPCVKEEPLYSAHPPVSSRHWFQKTRSSPCQYTEIWESSFPLRKM